jgi:hypothetical protein
MDLRNTIVTVGAAAGLAMLRHVFDPPPDVLAAPWLLLGAPATAALLGAVIAIGTAARGLRRLPFGSILREP